MRQVTTRQFQRLPASLPADARNRTERAARVSELVFRIDNVTKYKPGEYIKSPRKMIELFKYQLMVYPMGEAGDTFTVYLQRVPVDGVDPRFVYENVDYEISIMNHRDDQEAMTSGKVKGSFAADARVRGFEKNIIDQVPRSAYVDGDGGMVIKARVDLNNSRLSPAEFFPDEEGFWIEDIADFKKGEDMKFRPSWIGNYRTRVVVYPGGHPDHADGQEGLAVYVHVLESKGTEMIAHPLKLKVTLVNHKMKVNSISWVGTFQPDGAGDDSWGPNRLLSVADLKDDSKGWLDSDGELFCEEEENVSEDRRGMTGFVFKTHIQT
ncbi:hypothetical protein FOZ63_028128 [Perkinsus olseni]|uniref:MATH domain-containing protein n=1 Tax=Perkinsus olseni TaxID=32597 RepID=A0A7J6P2N6_PEROL|nr:hypothetical protein FOZ60_000663 [Perkinsus olseni]KAF4733411.1 hypothetical protein FOZ63_028128 [Perkinsus olseni]